VEKTDAEKGYYDDPEAFGQPFEEGIEYRRMKKDQELREKAE